MIEQNAPDVVFSKILRQQTSKLVTQQLQNALLVAMVSVSLWEVFVCFFRSNNLALTLTATCIELLLLLFLYFLSRKNTQHSVVFYHIILVSLTVFVSIFLYHSLPSEFPYYLLITAVSYLLFHFLVLIDNRNAIFQGIFTGIALIVNIMIYEKNWVNFVEAGVLFVILLVFSVFLAKIRYELSQRELTAQIIIQHTNKKLHQQQQEIQTQHQQIIKKEHNLRIILENNDNSIWLIDRNYTLLDYNFLFQKNMTQLTQNRYKTGDNILYSHHFSDGVFDTWKDRYDKVLAGSSQHYIDFYAQPEEVYFRVSLYPIYENDEITGVVGFSQDVTKEKQAEKSSKATQDILTAINNNIQEGIYRSTISEGFIYVNEAFVRLFGYTNIEEVLKIETQNFYANPETRNEILEEIKYTGKLTNQEVLLRRKDGSTFWGLMSITVKTENEVVILDGAIRDISDSKEIQQKLQEQNEELKKINSELDRFVYSASHDLKAPLASVLGLINIATYETNRQALGEYLQMMKQSVQRLDNFIREIVHYSRNARTEVSSNEINFHFLIREIYEDLQYLDKSRRINKRLHIPEGLKFHTDRRRLAIIFSNLISNAINYSNLNEQEPFLEIRVASKKLSSQKNIDGIVIEIKDNGLGIAQEHLPKIFDMFYRASMASKGSGIGLYIVKETVTKLGGTISVSSELGLGSCFVIEIPDIPVTQNFEDDEDMSIKVREDL